MNRWFALARSLDQSEYEPTHYAERFITISKLIPDFRSNPLLLGLTAQLYATPSSVPGHLTTLVEKSVELLLNEWDRKRGVATAREISVPLESALGRLAFQMLDDDTPILAEHDVLSIITESLAEGYLKPGDAASTARAVLAFAQERAWVLAEVGEGLYQFTHRTIMEYLAATHLLSGATPERDLAWRLSNPNWSNAVNLVLELVDQRKYLDPKEFAPNLAHEIDQLPTKNRRSALAFLEARARGRSAETAEVDTGLLVLSLAASKSPNVLQVRQQLPLGGVDAKTAARVEKFGEVAYRHKKFIERHGSMKRADSLAIRRELYGKKVQSTANLFGAPDSHALFWMDRQSRSGAKDDDPVGLTVEGKRIAELWQATHDRPDR